MIIEHSERNLLRLGEKVGNHIVLQWMLLYSHFLGNS